MTFTGNQLAKAWGIGEANGEPTELDEESLAAQWLAANVNPGEAERILERAIENHEALQSLLGNSP